MRRRVVKVVTLAVIGACLLSLRLAPPVWRAVMMVYATSQQTVIEDDLRMLGWPSTAAVNRAARTEKLGVYGDLAAAQHAWYRGAAEPPESPGAAPWPDAYRAAVRRHPDAPAAHLYLAARLLSSTQELNGHEPYEHQAMFDHVPPGSRVIKMQLLTADGPADMAEAMRSLRTAVRLAPDNAAPCYLLAYARFLMGDNAAAERALADAVARPRWSTYDLEVQRALLRLYERAAPTTFYLLMDEVPQYVAEIPGARRSLAYILTDLGDQRRRAGDDERAVFYYRAAFKFGAAVMAGANDDYTGFTGSWVVSGVGRSLVTPTRWQQYAKLPYEERWTRARAQRAADLQAYFRSVGRADVAAEYAGAFAHAVRFQRDKRRVDSEPDGWSPVEEIVKQRGAVAAVIAWEHVGWVLALLLLTGILSLAARAWRATGVPPAWRASQWAIIAALALGLNYAVVLGGPRWRGLGENASDMFRLPYFPDPARVLAYSAGALPLLVLAIVVISLVKRRRQPAASRMGKVQGILASLRILLPPTLALTLVIAVILTIPPQTKLQRVADHQKRILQVGEVAYWGLGRDGGVKTAGR